MKELSLLFFLLFFCLGVQGQNQGKNDVFVTGIVCDRDSIRPLPEAIFRLGKEVRGVDKQGRFSLSVQVGDTLRFSHIGYAPTQVVISDSKTVSRTIKTPSKKSFSLKLSEITT